MAEKKPLPEVEVQQFIAAHPGWAIQDNALVRTYEAPTFLKGIALVEQIAQVAEKADHHPDIDIRWRRVTIRLITHDAGNRVTALDLQLAKECDRLFSQLCQ